MYKSFNGKYHMTTKHVEWYASIKCLGVRCWWLPLPVPVAGSGTLGASSQQQLKIELILIFNIQSQAVL